MAVPSYIPDVVWTHLREKDKDEFYVMEAHIKFLKTNKNRIESCRQIVAQIIAYTKLDTQNINYRAIVAGLYSSEKFILINYVQLSKLTGFSRSFLTNYFTEIGYSCAKSSNDTEVKQHLPELNNNPLYLRQWVLRYLIIKDYSAPDNSICTTQQSQELLINEFRHKMVGILNLGAIREDKAAELLCLIRDPKYISIPTSIMAASPLLSASFFYRHRKEHALCDGRKGHSGRKSKLSQAEEASIIDICTNRRNEMRVVSLRWTAEKIESTFSIRVSLSYVHNITWCRSLSFKGNMMAFSFLMET